MNKEGQKIEQKQEQKVEQEITPEKIAPEFLKEIEKLAQEEKEKIKKKGRPKKEVIEEKKIDISIIAQGLPTFFKNIFSIIAKRKGEHWNLSDEEANGLGNSAELLIQKYGEKLMKFLPEIMFCFWLGIILITRFTQDIEIHKKKKESEKRK